MTTATAVSTPLLARPTAPFTDVSAETIEQRVAVRREALLAMDSFVSPLMAEELRLPMAFGQPAVELTIYEQVYRRSSAGGHWTLSSRWMDPIGHTIAGYTVALHFDGLDQPARFVIEGARRVETADASREALVRALADVARSGPLMTWAPNFVTDISL
jgi:hypothetical protein